MHDLRSSASFKRKRSHEAPCPQKAQGFFFALKLAAMFFNFSLLTLYPIFVRYYTNIYAGSQEKFTTNEHEDNLLKLTNISNIDDITIEFIIT